MTCQKHPIITQKVSSILSFTCHVIQDRISKEIKILNKLKATQDTHISTKIIKENSDIFSHFLTSNFNKYIDSSTFLVLQKLANKTPVHKKVPRAAKTTTDCENFVKHI